MLTNQPHKRVTQRTINRITGACKQKKNKTMTDKEAYELLLKYCGGEKGLLMIKEMIHVAGIETATNNMIIVYEQNLGKIPDEFKQWIYQGFKYVQKEMSKSLS
jgi:hypothetical protein